MSERENDGGSAGRQFRVAILALCSALIPLGAAFGVAAAVGPGPAKPDYYAAVAQILPLLFIALVIERNYFFRAVAPPGDPFENVLAPLRGSKQALLRAVADLSHVYWSVYGVWTTLTALVYQLALLALLAIGELSALRALATGTPSNTDLLWTSGAASGGFAAAVVLAGLNALSPPDPAKGARAEAASPPPNSDVTHELERAANLRDSGVLTEQEFQALKSKLLSP